MKCEHAHSAKNCPQRAARRTSSISIQSEPLPTMVTSSFMAELTNADGSGPSTSNFSEPSNNTINSSFQVPLVPNRIRVASDAMVTLTDEEDTYEVSIESGDGMSDGLAGIGIEQIGPSQVPATATSLYVHAGGSTSQNCEEDNLSDQNSSDSDPDYSEVGQITQQNIADQRIEHHLKGA